MDDLFRFVLLRPADLPAPDAVKVLQPQAVTTDQSKGRARRAAAGYLASDQVVRRVEQVPAASAALAVRAAAEAGPISQTELAELLTGLGEPTVRTIVTDDAFAAAETSVADTLVATKLVSDSAGTDARALAHLAQGLDLLRRASDGIDPIGLRPLAMPTFGARTDENTYPSRRLDPQSTTDQPDPAGDRPTPPDPHLARLETAAEQLRRVRASDFARPAATESRSEHSAEEAPNTQEQDAPPANRDTGGRAPTERLSAAQNTGPIRSTGRQATPGAANPATTPRESWTLSSQAVAAIPAGVRETIDRLGLDLSSTPLPVVMNTLEQRTNDLLLTDTTLQSSAAAIFAIGSSFVGAGPAGDYVGHPSQPMPKGHGSLHPVGIADLLLVKQHLVRYEGGEVAHVENVLKSEHLSRETRRLDRTETTILTESETTHEDERDTQSTDRFSLKRETSSTIKQDTEFKAGVTVDAKYGPFVEVKATADFATKGSSEESAKQASEFSKDVVARSVSKVVERVLERRSTTTIAEFEEKYSHGFDNTGGGGNISGVYQWVDKVLQAQVYNYGKRMLFDVTLPEPATAYVIAQAMNTDEKAKLTKPDPFTLRADQLTLANYTTYAQRYDVTGLEAPPVRYKTVSKAFDAVVSQDPYESTKSQDLVIDDGYEAKYALFQRDFWFYPNAAWRIMVGSNWINAMGPTGYVDMADEVGTVAVAYYAHGIRNLAATVEIFCERTSRAMTVWQLKTHAAITSGYLAKLQAYESDLAAAAAAGGVVITGRNPLWNQRLLSTELRKQCVELLTAQHFDAFGALELSTQGYPQPNFARVDAQMPYVRFFEQAFEWEHIAYFFYPYFWGWKPAWGQRMLLDDVDPLFADFLRAGAARVVFPVRPGFEAAVAHYLESGEIWNGGPAPDVTDPLYVPIIKEIQEATGAPGAEVPQGEPWLVRLPTTLTKLRPDDTLPTWTKVGEDWQPTP